MPIIELLVSNKPELEKDLWLASLNLAGGAAVRRRAEGLALKDRRSQNPRASAARPASGAVFAQLASRCAGAPVGSRGSRGNARRRAQR